MAQPAATVPHAGIRSCFNDSGVEIAANVAVMLDAGGEKHIDLPSAYTVALYGVTMAAIPDGEWGDVQMLGVALVKAAGALATPGVQLMADTDGKAEEFTAAKDVNCHVLGQLLTTAAALNDLVEVDLNGLGSIQQGDT